MNETVLITGASSGIGMELARLFAADKWNRCDRSVTGTQHALVAANVNPNGASVRPAKGEALVH